MSRVLLGILIGAAGLYAYEHYGHRPVASVERMADTERQTEAAPPPENDRFHCDGRVYCSQMTSCDEAMYFLEHCPGVKMDGEGDGVPCERQWCGNRR